MIRLFAGLYFILYLMCLNTKHTMHLMCCVAYNIYFHGVIMLLFLLCFFIFKECLEVFVSRELDYSSGIRVHSIF